MLTSEDIKFIEANSGADVTRLLLGKAPEGVNLQLCAKCIQAREKMKVKAPLWYGNPALVYPFSVSVEQGSSQYTAIYKQELVKGLLAGAEGAEGKITTADLTGGMGIDSWFISRIAAKHFYFERTAELAQATEYNFRQLGAENVVFSSRDILSDDCAVLRELQGQGIDLIYIDPARRTSSGGKAILLQDYEPDVIALQELLFSASRYILVKVSPMADIKLNLKHLPFTSQVHVIAVDNECKELLFLLDREHNGEEPQIRCVNISTSGGAGEPFAFTFSQEEAAVPQYTSKIGKYLWEPSKAVLKGGAYKLVSQIFGAAKLAPSTHLYTSDEKIEGFPGKLFVVEEVIPFNKKSLKEVASRYPKADLTARNFPLDTNALKKLSGIKDGGDKHIFAITVFNGEKMLAVASVVRKWSNLEQNQICVSL